MYSQYTTVEPLSHGKKLFFNWGGMVYHVFTFSILMVKREGLF